MKIFRRVLFVLATIVTTLWITGNNHIYLGLYDTYLQGRTKPAVDDLNLFPTRKIPTSNPVKWEKSKNYNTETLSEKVLAAHQTIGSKAFLVIKNDSLVHESYYDGADENYLGNSFSIAKTFLSIITGVAIKEGKIDVSLPVNQYLPEYVQEKDSALTVKELLNMTSGMNFDENYGNPFGFMAKAYYGDDIKNLLLGYHLELSPGSQWKYLGGNNLLLSLLLEKALGETVSDYAAAKIWQPLQMETDAFWILDHKNGNEKTFSGLYATAKDFARLGALYLHKGNWNGLQIVDSSFVKASIQPVNVKDETGTLIDYYGYAWWLVNYQNQDIFYMQGILGQYVICIPENNTIIVRLGKDRMEKSNGKNPDDLFIWIEEGLRLVQ